MTVLEVETTVNPMQTPFIKALVSLKRAEDAYGVWEGKSDESLLSEFIVTKEARRELPIIGDPDPDVLHRVEQFYQALGLAIERISGHMASPMMKMSHEGFGRVVLTTGKLVVFSKSLRDVHRFGFDTLEKLADEGMKSVAKAVDTIKTYPEVAAA
jgi:probable nitrogen fixation protein